MPEKCKVGFWKWLLIKSPRSVLGIAFRERWLLLTAIFFVFAVFAVGWVACFGWEWYKAIIVVFVWLIIAGRSYYLEFVCKGGE